MEQRQPAEHHIVRGQLEQPLRDDLGVAAQVVVGELRALRGAGCPGRVQDHRRVRAVPFHHPVHRGCGREHFGERWVDDDRLRTCRGRSGEHFGGRHRAGEDHRRTGIGEMVGDLAGLEQRVHRHHDGARAKHSVVDGRELRDVREHDGHPVAGPHPVLGQQPGHLPGQLVEGTIRSSSAHLSERRPDRGGRPRCARDSLRDSLIRLHCSERFVLEAPVHPDAQCVVFADCSH